MTPAFAPPVISVDLEDWPQSTWDKSLPITARAALNTRRLLGLLDELGVRATMFVLGKFAEAFPEVVRECDAAGHEVASHGWGHIEIFKQTREEFAADLQRAKDLLEQLIGKPVRGYRAPDFSIVRGNLWALEAIAEAGFDYDSSIFPVRHPRYGIPDWPPYPARLRLGNGAHIIEMPIATITLFGCNLPVGGGGYHRLLPGVLARELSRRAMQAAPFVLYCHPYELDPAEFKETTLRLPLRVKLHQGLGRSLFARRLRTFVREFGGRRMQDAVYAQNWPAFDLSASAIAGGSDRFPGLVRAEAGVAPGKRNRDH